MVEPSVRRISTRPPNAFSAGSMEWYRRVHSGSSVVVTRRQRSTVSGRPARSGAYESTWCQAPSCSATVKMYGIEWSSVSRLARGSYFCGSFAPDPMTTCVWCEEWMRTRSIASASASTGCAWCRRRARSIHACAWYSAECSFVYVSRIARFASPGAGSGTS
ncbi:hypothetical protein BC477_03095 [Clavibacter michiganensis subsp. michiganensis]|uniref:Uncharacterized protein n=1 Tax=Clavibacter michiganensis subsp. michiganensis TaxID=33013 RepID=A0A251XKY2_CLAMM|nr:hypothetical protein BC477_03095 [Clavibacter michiganensis subsp. michiganensis]OUE03698.1 hypothetical protein CMMCAS07_02030 [Clavibacter michiganensis subsp. michiganensis]